MRRAKRHWNAWAEDMLAKQKALKESGAWTAEEVWSVLEPKNAETRTWMEETEVRFSRCLFLSRGDMEGSLLR
jgi:hypothetical protein